MGKIIMRIKQPSGITAIECPIFSYEIECLQDYGRRITLQLLRPLRILPQPSESWPKEGLWLAAVDYVHREIHAANRALANAQDRKGVTREELENLEKKIAVLDWLARLAIDKGEYV